jgi:predicted phosphoribosyltransferase
MIYLPLENMSAFRETKSLRNRVQVFADRSDAGAKLAGMIKTDIGFHSEADRSCDSFGRSSGGREDIGGLCIGLEVLPVNKITFPWNTESAFVCMFLLDDRL